MILLSLKNHPITVVNKSVRFISHFILKRFLIWTAVIVVLVQYSCNKELKQAAFALPDPSNCFQLPAEGSDDWIQWPEERLSAYYKLMRKTKPGCYRNFKSDWHKASVRFAEILPSQSLSQKDLAELLDDPDVIINHGNLDQYDPPRDEAVRNALSLLRTGDQTALHIYFWRGWHDYLYFYFKNDILTDSGMYYAYE